MDIYIKPKEKHAETKPKALRIADLAKVIAQDDLTKKINAMKVLEIESKETRSYVVSITDFVLLIKKKYPEATVYNLGAQDTVVFFDPKKRNPNPLWTFLKITFVSIILLAGSATAIMSFHTDAQIPKVFQNYYRIFFGEDSEKPLLLDIPYSVGLAAGIIIFFNHFLGKKVVQDPTPIDVEMTLYDQDVVETVVAMQSEGNGRQDG
ncbi:MAG: stage V sporulation protein AA [Clostridiales bacterium]|jgi:stage V sporulation protein AA|nr:stage V sporulation protein AA [Clostridiales bacterium]